MHVQERVDRFVLRGEALLGRHGFAVAQAVMWMGVAALVVRPGTRPVELGRFYAQLSLDPFAFEVGNPVGFRILTPLLSWAIGLRGEAIMVTNLVLATALLVAVFAVFRRRAPRAGDALVAAGTMALSLVTLSTIFSPSYCDPATYLAVLGMWWARGRRPLFYAIFLLGLLNRESIVFLVPWFAYLDLVVDPRDPQRKGRLVAEQLLGYGAALVLLLLFRAWVASQGEVVFTLDYYLAPLRDDPLHFFRRSAGNQWIGLYSVFGVLWPIPAAATVARWRRGDRRGAASIPVLLLCTWSQLFVAYDTSRMFTLGFMAMLVALEDAFADDRIRLRDWAPWLLLFQALAPQLRTAQQRVWVMDSLWSDLLRQALSVQ